MNNDLISRSALKEQISELHSHDDSIDIWLKREDVDNLIDNAPTVDLTKNQAYDKGFITAMKLYARPQGEWIAREDMDYLDENKVVHNHFECNKCGLIHDFIDGHTSQYNFCPQCGAEMQKGGAE